MIRNYEFWLIEILRMKHETGTMKKLILVAGLVFHGSASRVSFDAGYLFHRGDGDFAAPAFDDTKWTRTDVPHDWSALDLPAREEDVSTPTIAVRYRTWLFATGDDMAWSAPGFDDSAWMRGRFGGKDWREFANYDTPHAKGWFRQHFDADGAWQVNATVSNPNGVILSLGVVAGADVTYLNGKIIGSMGNISDPDPATYTFWRRYKIPAHVLKEKGNVLAVRVASIGGAGPLSKDGSTGYPGGLYDDPTLFDADFRSGPWDASTSPNGRSLGYSVGGYGWYRKHFNSSVRAAGPTFLVFDGIYMNSTVFLNGNKVGARPYGYSSFVVDITNHLLPPKQDNVLAIKVSNLGMNSRWYSGSGIFRHVWLVTNPAESPVYVPVWGVHVSTPSIVLQEPGKALTAVVNIQVDLINRIGTWIGEGTDVSVHVKLLDPDGKTIVGNAIKRISVKTESTASINITLLNNIKLWSSDTPALYRTQVQIIEVNGFSMKSIYPVITTRFGIRHLSFSVASGFQINGVTTKLRGGCLHHANGPLGSRAFDRSEYRRVEILKKAGYNAIRTSHNPVSPAFLDACDEIGIYVMDEAFDCWNIGKNPDDYSVYFADWWQKDLSTMIRRDRNHPSIIMWSIGNEIPGRNTPTGYHLSHTLAAFVRGLESGGSQRAITSAYPFVQDDADEYFSALDVAGYNYSPNRYQSDHLRKPDRIIVGTESFPTSSFEMWSQVWNSSWVIGDFIWTNIDYIGESAIGYSTQDGDVDQYGKTLPPFSFHISYCGDFDIVGHRKPQGIYRQVLWNVTKMEMVVHRPLANNVSSIAREQPEWVSRWGWPDEVESWTWDGYDNTTNMSVRVFTWHCNTVDLRLNGKSVGKKAVGYDTELIATFSVPYVPGVLRAVCSSDYSISAVLKTALSPAKLVVEADRVSVFNDPNELVYVTVAVQDVHGTHVPNTQVPVTFQVRGAGILLASGSGNPRDLTSFQSATWNTWRGRVVAIAQPNAEGMMTVRATALLGNGKVIQDVHIEVKARVAADE